MDADLSGIPFDHFQRYAAAARVLSAVLPVGSRILEVGANRQRLLGMFLPRHSLVYSDLEPQDEPDFVVADAAALPFETASYDAVVSLDVLEHIPQDARDAAVEEMSRVAAKLVVICCPTDRPWVHAAEESANAVWRAAMGGDYPWLAEHQEHGLVDPDRVLEALRRSGLNASRIGQGDPDLWSKLMGAHFAKEAVSELAPVVSELDRTYNRSVFDGDFGERGYRDIFVGARTQSDLQAALAVLSGESTQVTAVRATLADASASLGSVVHRVLAAEGQWRDTAALYADAEQRLRRECDARHRTGLELEAAEARALEQFRRADRSDQRALELELEMARLAERTEQAERRSHELEQRAAEQFDRAERADENTRQAELRREHDATRAAAAEQRAGQLTDEVTHLEAELRATAAQRDELHAHTVRLAARVAGLERRQRWGAIAAGGVAVAAIIVLLVLA